MVFRIKRFLGGGKNLLDGAVEDFRWCSTAEKQK
jgi:hypothetical protein